MSALRRGLAQAWTTVRETHLAAYDANVNKPYLVRAEWDAEASVWVATSDDAPGLAAEAETIESLAAMLRTMVPELLNTDGHLPVDVNVEVELLARRRIDAGGVSRREQLGEPNHERFVCNADPLERLSAAELGQALGTDEMEVHRRESAGELFSVVFPRAGPERVYPAFQAWPGIAGDLLAAVLAALDVKANGGVGAYAFFCSPNDLVGHLTPIEVLAGYRTTERALDDSAFRLLGRPPEERLAAVLSTAQAYLAQAQV